MFNIDRSLSLKLFGCALIPIITLIVVLNLRSNPSMETVSGQSYHWKGEKWTLINYFAEWCSPCLEELPELNKLEKSKELRVLGISYDYLSNADIKSLVERYQIEFPMLTTASLKKLPLPLPRVLPTTYIISPNGEVIDVLHGKVTEEIIQDLLIAHKKN